MNETADICMRNARELAELGSRRRVRVAGITGGIASGKTVATDALARAGFKIADADEVSRGLTRRGSKAEKALCEMFPFAAVDGALDRRLLRNAIAHDPELKRRLEEYTHPLINAEIERVVSSADRIVLSAPLLFETALSRLCDVTVCVTCPTRLKIERLVRRDGISPSAARAMIDAQIPDMYRATLADFCIPSDVGLAEFEAEAVALFNKIFGL